MARKVSANLRNAPVKLSKDSQAFIKRMQKTEVPEGTQEQYDRWVKATIEVEEQAARVDQLGKLVDAKGSDDPNWPSYQEALKLQARLVHAAFGACDAWRHVCKVKSDETMTNVDREDAKQIISDSLGYSTEGLSFSVPVGLLAHKVLEEVFKHTVREEEQDAPLCDACA